MKNEYSDDPIVKKLRKFRALYRAYKEQGDENTLKEMTNFLNENEDVRVSFNRFIYSVLGEELYEELKQKATKT